MVNIYNTNKKPFYIFLTFWFVLFLAPYLYLMLMANLDLTTPYALFMDEDITFRGIRNIFNSKNYFEFKSNVMDGKDQRYGRILWNLSALTSYIPYQFFGDSGQIFTTRITQAFILLASYILLVSNFLKNSYLKVITLSILMTLPYTPYYASMPKPEPILLFLLSLFFTIQGSKIEPISKLNGFIIGMALGAKISALPFFLATNILWITNIFLNQVYSKLQKIKIFLSTFLFTILGLCFSVPILFEGRLNKYLEYTIKNTGHGADNSDVNLLSWVDAIFNNYFNFPIKLISEISLFSILLIGVLILSKRVSINKNNFFHQLFKSLTDKKIMAIICMLSFSLPVLLFVKRVWLMYLHVGTVFFIVLGISGLEIYLTKFKKSGKALIYISSMYAFYILTFQTVSTYQEFQLLANRTNTEEHIRKENERKFLLTLIEKRATKLKKNLKVSAHPRLYWKTQSEHFTISPFWGPFTLWSSNFDLVVMYKESEPEEWMKRINEKSKNFEIVKKSIELKREFTNNCKSKPICYSKIESPIPELVIYKKMRDLK